MPWGIFSHAVETFFPSRGESFPMPLGIFSQAVETFFPCRWESFPMPLGIFSQAVETFPRPLKLLSQTVGKVIALSYVDLSLAYL